TRLPRRRPLDLAERFLAHQVGTTVDTYHLWWDDTAPAQLARADAKSRIHPVQLADWTTPSPRAPSPAATSSATARSTSGHGSGTWTRPTTPARSRSSCSTRPCGPATAARS